jgi:site-specific recombinase XerC
MPPAGSRHADPFGRVAKLLSTSSSAGIDLLALRELMGHANPETTAAYVHLSPQTLAAEYARARAAAR